MPGFLDDHAQIGLGFITLYETTGDDRWFERAAQLADEIIRRFSGPDGGFFMTAEDAEALVIRPTDIIDTSAPSGTAAASELLLRLARFTGDQQLEDRARHAIAPLVAQARAHPAGFGHALSVADLLIGPVREVAIVGGRSAAGTSRLVHEVFAARYLPNTVTAIGEPGGATSVPLLAGRTAVDDLPTAYVCERFACRLPTSDPAVLASLLTA